jgi:hypothetical protein
VRLRIVKTYSDRLNVELDHNELSLKAVATEFPKAWDLTCPLEGCNVSMRVFCYLREAVNGFNVNYNLGSCDRHFRTNHSNDEQLHEIMETEYLEEADLDEVESE